MILPSCRKLFCLSAGKKLNFIPHAFMKILQRYANLFWLLWACLVTLTQNDSIVLLKTWMFICMQKINFIIHFFLTILHFKEFCNLIGRQHFGPQLETQNYARYVGEISITILVFIIDYFQEKLTWQSFSKNPKHHILGPFWVLFAQIWTKNKFSWKKGLCQFFNIRIIYHCAKNQKNLMSHSWENCWRDTPKTSLFH